MQKLSLQPSCIAYTHEPIFNLKSFYFIENVTNIFKHHKKCCGFAYLLQFNDLIEILSKHAIKIEYILYTIYTQIHCGSMCTQTYVNAMYICQCDQMNAYSIFKWVCVYTMLNECFVY